SVHLGNPDQRTSVQLLTQDAVDRGRVTMRFFDLFDVEARRVLLADLPIDHAGVRAGERRRVHLVILGLGRMGRAVAVRAAQVGHFANSALDHRFRLKISVVDRISTDSQRLRLFAYPQLESCCELDPHQGEIESADTLALLQRWCNDPTTMTSVVICVNDESRAALTATRMMPLLHDSSARLAVRLSHRTGLHSVMDLARTHGTSAAVTSFGAIADGCCHTAFEAEDREQLAISIHEAYRASIETKANANDAALQPWRSLREVLRESNRLQADHIGIKLRAIGCVSAPTSDARPAVQQFGTGADGTDEVELLARMEHDRWNAERWLGGWVYAPGKKNVDKRTSPYLVPWVAEELPESVREYDRNAVRAIPGHSARVGRKVVRSP
ncbi:MAG: hypothetical protein IT360_27245, partial [Gemmatimonadaceae bacterium]|nr:hypothetical protein [Gemmatimonadaceae bacterium]